MKTMLYSGLSVGTGSLLLAILSTTPSVFATAYPHPAPVPYIAPDYSARVVPHHANPIVYHNRLSKRLDSSHTSQGSAFNPKNHSFTKRMADEYRTFKRSSSAGSLFFARDVVSDFEDLLNGFSNGKSDAQDNANALRALAEQSGVADDDDGYQQNAATQTTALYSLLHNLDVLLKQAGGGDKGLANYDKNSKLETLLKDIVNANKDALTSVDLMVYNIPTLGPVLGPIVYEIKCIIEDILNLTENVTDGLLNALGPGFSGLLGQANAINCSSNLKLLGFCI